MNKNSSFSVPGVMEARVESFTNPVAGQQREPIVLLPEGFIWNLVGETKTKIMCIVTSSLNFEHTRQRSFLFIREIQGSVICWLNFGQTKKKKESQMGVTGSPISISIV